MEGAIADEELDIRLRSREIALRVYILLEAEDPTDFTFSLGIFDSQNSVLQSLKLAAVEK